MEIINDIKKFIREHPKDILAYKDLLDALAWQIPVDSSLRDENRALREQITTMIHDPLLDVSTANELDKINKRSLLLDAVVDFDAYMQYVEYERDPSKKFYMPRRRVLRPTVSDLQDLVDGKLDLLSISMPPGSGKSTLGIFLLSWLVGKFPDKPNLASAHSGLLTRSFFDGVLGIITDPDYLWGEVFPTHVLHDTNTKEETIDIDKKHRFSSLTCRAINASLTGATRCEELLYADDLVSGIEEAMNKERLDSLWQKYTNDLKSRKKLGAKELHIATRWSVHDVIGRLERMYSNDPRCKFIVLPALNERGESNFNYDYGVGFDTKYFIDMQNNLDDASFRALFMNEPIEREGQLYHPSELRRYFELPTENPDAIISICDTKNTGKDYAFLPVAYVYGNDYYVADCVCDNGKPEIVDNRVVDILMKHHVNLCRFESNNAGSRVAYHTQCEITRRGGNTFITSKTTNENKETKIVVNSPWVKEHCLFLDDSCVKPGTDYRRMMEMLCGYSMMGKNPHDDVPDGMAMLALYAQSLTGNRVEVFKRPY